MAQKGHLSKTTQLCSTIFRLTISRNDPIPITDSVEQTNLCSYQKKKKYQGNRRRDKITDRSFDENGNCFFALLQVLPVTSAPIFPCC